MTGAWRDRDSSEGGHWKLVAAAGSVLVLGVIALLVALFGAGGMFSSASDTVRAAATAPPLSTPPVTVASAPARPTVPPTSSTTVTTAPALFPPASVPVDDFPTPVPGQEYLVATALGNVRVYDAIPPAGSLQDTMPQHTRYGNSTPFLVLRQSTDGAGQVWYQAYLPRRPNMSKGWIRASEVKTHRVIYDIRIDLSAHRMELYEHGKKVREYPVGVGKTYWPTPQGNFFVAVVLQPNNPYGVYGPLQLGLSAYSDVLTDWPGGGQVAIHGTNNPSGIGTDISHGCVRMHNRDIMDLAGFAEVGTPVYIRK
jgi:lipoprotein-anchoring transpeptidase ErfK/SrfK